MDIANWLRALGLERYEATFRENDVTAQLLPRLTSDDLKDLGITSVGHRRQLQDAIAALLGADRGDQVSGDGMPVGCHGAEDLRQVCDVGQHHRIGDEAGVF